jgi:hypothetical protein
MPVLPRFLTISTILSQTDATAQRYSDSRWPKYEQPIMLRKKRYTGRRHRLQRVSIFAETSIASVLILAGTMPRPYRTRMLPKQQ